MDFDNTLSEQIVAEALRIGFARCGISEAGRLDFHSDMIERWLSQGHEGEMGYMQRNKEKRYDPRLLVEGTKTILSATLNYFPKEEINPDGRLKIAKYAYGKDYHEVVKHRLNLLLDFIESATGRDLSTSRMFTDSAPVMDRAWAVNCGLGFIGKNNTLIDPKRGSFLFIGHLFLPIELAPIGKPIENHCGRCHRCIDACPTGALTAFSIDARKCLSYLTVEYKGELPPGTDLHGCILGCDICQDVCPYNQRFATPNNIDEFAPSDALRAMTDDDWKNLNEEAYAKISPHSALKRAGMGTLKRNANNYREL